MKDFYVKGTIYGLTVCIKVDDAKSTQEALRDVLDLFPSLNIQMIYNKAGQITA